MFTSLLSAKRQTPEQVAIRSSASHDTLLIAAPVETVQVNGFPHYLYRQITWRVAVPPGITLLLRGLQTLSQQSARAEYATLGHRTARKALSVSMTD